MIAFKNRKIDRRKTVQVYRNLHDKSGNKRWSIRQNGLIVAHTKRLCLRDVTFVASQRGMSRAKKLGHKIVCAYAQGRIIPSCMGRDSTGILAARLRFVMGVGFVHELTILSVEQRKVRGAMAAILNEHGMSASYTY